MSGSLGRRAFKPVYLAYYRFLYGRSFPGAQALERRVRAWERLTGRGDAPAPSEVWDAQYASGRWELMRAADEVARYSVIAGWLHRLCPGGRVLDVGSGEGILLDHLRPHGVGAYVGIDLSAVAVARGQERFAALPAGAASFVAADAEAWSPAPASPGAAPASFDALVFNECVYYFEQPVDTVLRYQKFRAPQGVTVVSAFRSRRADVIRRRLGDVLPLRDEVSLVHGKGTWVIGLYG